MPANSISNTWTAGFAPTIRLRTEGTDHLLAAAQASDVAHFVAQSYAAWNGIGKVGG